MALTCGHRGVDWNGLSDRLWRTVPSVRNAWQRIQKWDAKRVAKFWRKFWTAIGENETHPLSHDEVDRLRRHLVSHR
jgi:hypothetical protein